MKLTQKQKAKVEKQLLTILPATLDEALKGLTNTERTYAAHLVRQVPKFGDEFAKCIETYAGYLGEDLDPTDRARNNVTPTFNRDDYIHWEPTTDPSLTYPQQLEVWRVEMLEKRYKTRSSFRRMVWPPTAGRSMSMACASNRLTRAPWLLSGQMKASSKASRLAWTGSSAEQAPRAA
jgi:hypothetical protein